MESQQVISYIYILINTIYSIIYDLHTLYSLATANLYYNLDNIYVREFP